MATFSRLIPAAQRIIPSKETRAKMWKGIQTGAHDMHHWHPRHFEFPNPQDLRGIPAIGRGVAGRIPGTNPEQVLDREDAA